MCIRDSLKHAPKPHLGYGIISFFCVLAPEGMNAIVFGRDKGKKSERFPLTRKMCALPEAISVGGVNPHLI